jgi:hypothetical protein
MCGQMFWRKKPAYVEWDLVGNESSGFGAHIFLSAAPMVIVHQIDADHRTYRNVAAAVEQWVALTPQKYRLNEEFEEFRALAHELDDDNP